jgi:hypothetical protein
MANIGGSSGAKYSGRSGMDPLTIAAIASSLLGPMLGGNDQQERKSYGGRVSPQNTLQDALDAVKSFGMQLESRGPARLRSTVPMPVGPVSIPGLGFQIGGGLGHDPALDDPMGGTGGRSMPSVFGELLGRSNGPSLPGQRGNTMPPASKVVDRTSTPPATGAQLRKKETF